MTNSKRLIALLWLIPVLVMAAVVTSAQIQQAIQNSPYASAWLKANAQAVANLAIRVESGGNTTAYNGSCCYGVLQMNRANIDKYAGVTPSQYQQWSLQQQIDAWSLLTVDALKAGSVRQLIDMGTFDGRTVDGNMVLACVQLGIGNCQKMINSGSCTGFADRNGTTICSMADKMAGVPAGGSGVGTGGTGTGGNGQAGASPGGSTPGSGWQPSESCPGGCLPTSSSMRQAFAQGSGVEMSALKDQSNRLGAAAVFLIMAASFAAIWSSYSDGRITTAQLKKYVIHGGITLSIVLGVMRML